MVRTYTVELRELADGGGWSLVLLTDGINTGGAAFPPGVEGYGAADEEGKAWVTPVTEQG